MICELNPIRVLHLVRSLEVGGLERLVVDLVRQRLPAETSVLCLTCLGPLGEQLRSEGVSVQALGIKKPSFSTFRQVSAAVRCAGPHVIHCHNMMAHLHAALAARFNGRLPVVLTKHGTVTFSRGIANRLSRRLARRTEIVAVSDDVRNVMRRWVPSAGDVHCIRNGISLVPYQTCASRREAVRHRLGWDADTVVFGCVARLAPSKDHQTLLEAFALAASEREKARLVVVGDGPLRTELERSVQRLGLTDRVEMLGECNDVPDLLAAFDVFVLSSRNEGFPMTLLEAMAARLPIVATAVGGVSEIVVEGENGLLVEPASARGLAKALITIHDQPDFRRDAGEAGRRRAESDFDIAIVAGRYEAVYQHLALGGKHE